MFYPLKSYRHPALRDLAGASVVYDDWTILVAKVQRFFELWSLKAKNLQKNLGLAKKLFKDVPGWCSLFDVIHEKIFIENSKFTYIPT